MEPFGSVIEAGRAIAGLVPINRSIHVSNARAQVRKALELNRGHIHLVSVEVTVYGR